MQKINFKDRISKYPNRKRLKIISQSASEIVADVVNADSPQVEGTEINAKLLNQWQEVIEKTEGNATLAKTKVAEAIENSKNALETSQFAKNLAGKAVELVQNVNTSVSNLFIPIKTSDMFNDNKYVSAAKAQIFTEEEREQARANIGVKCGGFTGSFNELKDKPSIPTKTSELTNDAGFVSNDVDDLNNYSTKDKTVTGFNLTLNENTYVLTIELLNENGESLSTKSVDLPVESFVKNASYENGTLTLTLQNGQTIDIDISSMVTGLVPENRKINGKELSTDITLTADDLGLVVDEELSSTSENPVQNKVVSQKFSEIEQVKADKTELTNLSSSINDEIELLEDRSWEYVGKFVLSNDVDVWKIVYQPDFVNYEYRLDFNVVSNESNAELRIGFINSEHVYIYLPIEWVSVRSSNTTSGSSNTSVGGWAATSNSSATVPFVGNPAQSGMIINASLTFKRKDVTSTSNKIYFECLASINESGNHHMAITTGYVKNLPDGCQGWAINGKYKANSAVRLYRIRRQAW